MQVHEDTSRHEYCFLFAVPAVTTTVLLISVLWILARRLMLKIADVRRQIGEMAITGMLTGLRQVLRPAG